MVGHPSEDPRGRRRRDETAMDREEPSGLQHEGGGDPEREPDEHRGFDQAGHREAGDGGDREYRGDGRLSERRSKPARRIPGDDSLVADLDVLHAQPLEPEPGTAVDGNAAACPVSLERDDSGIRGIFRRFDGIRGPVAGFRHPDAAGPAPDRSVGLDQWGLISAVRSSSTPRRGRPSTSRTCRIRGER